MREITYAQALREALQEEMRRDARVFLMGEDVAVYGGAFRVSEGLLAEFGEERVRDTPISEAAITGAALGAAMVGMRPVVEIMFGDFTTLAMDQIVNQVAKVHYMSGGKVKAPLVIRTNLGGGRGQAAQHSQSLHAWFAHTPGLKVAIPSTPYDAKGLLKTAIRDDDPVVFFEHKLLYRMKGPVPEEEYLIPFGQVEVKREGSDVTIIALSRMVHMALEAARLLEAQGLSAEVIDPRTLTPLDEEALVASVQKTGRAVIVDEGWRRFGVTGELAAVLMEGAFDYLEAPIRRISAPDMPAPFSPPLEQAAVPSPERIVEAVLGIV